MRIVILPEPGYEGEMLWEPCSGDWHLLWLGLKSQLEEKGHEVVSYPTDADLTNAVGLYCGLPPYPTPTTEKSICVQLEPPVTPGRARFYERMGGLPFNRILTFVKNYVDEKRVFWEPVPLIPYAGALSPKRDKFICAVSGGGKEFPSVTVDGITYESLFPARRHAYLGFGKDLDLYGRGWEKDIEMINAVNYMGPCDNKIKTMSRYKYAIVFENTASCYTSEKYFDALQAGCELLYRGQIPKYNIGYADYRNWATRIINHLEAIT